MTWKDLLQKKDETIVYPWTGGRSFRTHDRTFTLEGRRPPEYGWYELAITGTRKASFKGPTEPRPEDLKRLVMGYLVGDLLIPDGASVELDVAKMAQAYEKVYLLEEGLDRFARVSAGRMADDGPLIFNGLEMPLGPEEEVLRAYLERKGDVNHIPGVHPALDASFRMETWQRVEAERRRAELERFRREEEEKRRKEDLRRELQEKLGDGASRRKMATVDFGEAARAALAVGGAELLDHRKSFQRGEMIVRFRFRHQQFECVCDALNLGVIDAGICLQDHDTGRKDDDLLTLENLPTVIAEATRLGKLVVFRHVGDHHDDYEDD